MYFTLLEQHSASAFTVSFIYIHLLFTEQVAKKINTID